MSNQKRQSSIRDAEARESALEQGGYSVANLRSAFQGQVIAPGDDGYDQARATFYGGFDHRPAVIIRPANVDDIVTAVTMARSTGMDLSVRSGGHSPAGHSVSDGGIMLDLCNLNAFEIDLDTRTAWAGAGLTAGEFTSLAGEHGLGVGFGDTGSVGIGGITLGGGIGFLVRKYGMTIDNLLATELVTADGQLVYADAENHPNLFWAIRGGGGNFGVATRFKYRLQPVDPFMGGILIMPATPEVVAGMVAAAEAAPEELSAIINVMPAPPMPMIPPEMLGKLVVFAMVGYLGQPGDAERALAPFRALAQPLADMVRPMPYSEMFQPDEGDYHPTAAGQTIFTDSFDLNAAKKVITGLNDSDAMFRVVQIRALGGEMARVPVEATAFAHRKRRIMVGIYAFYQGAEDREPKAAWARSLAGSLRLGEPGAYVGFLADEGKGRVREAYPAATWERLAEIKARYDPTNLFHLNQNISPAPRANA